MNKQINKQANNWFIEQAIHVDVILVVIVVFRSLFIESTFADADKLIISDPSELHDRSFMAHLNQLPWTAPLFTRKVEQTVLTGKHMTFCRVSNDSISVVCKIQIASLRLLPFSHFCAYIWIIELQSFIRPCLHWDGRTNGVVYTMTVMTWEIFRKLFPIYIHIWTRSPFLFSLSGGRNYTISKFYGVSERGESLSISLFHG